MAQWQKFKFKVNAVWFLSLLLLVGILSTNSCAITKMIKEGRAAIAHEQACDTLFHSGYYAFRDGDFQVAQTLFDSLVAIDTAGLQYEAHAYLAQCLLKTSSETEAKAVLTHALTHFTVIDSNATRFWERTNELKHWQVIFPKLAPELTPGPNFVLKIQPPEVSGGMEALYKKVEYPEMAREMQISGTVTVVARINSLGRVESATVKTGVHPDLDPAALAAVEATTFVPYSRYGRILPCKVTVPIVF